MAIPGAKSDFQQAEDAMRYLCDPGECSLQEQATKIVEEHWPEIDTLAQELLKYGTIDGDEAEIIVDIARGTCDMQMLELYRKSRP